jgi:aminoglycoside 6'-N-acetyltransferase I
MAGIRRLIDADRDEWLRLRQALWPRADPSALEQEMMDIIARPEAGAVFVAERPGGGLCGLIEISIRDRAEGCRTPNVGYIEGWYVDVDSRRFGVGTALVRAAEAWARAHGCSEMGSDTDSDYPISPAAHAALGYREVRRYIHYRKDL